MGAKRLLNGTSKVNRRTDGQTDGQINLQKASAQRADALKKHCPGGFKEVLCSQFARAPAPHVSDEFQLLFKKFEDQEFINFHFVV